MDATDARSDGVAVLIPVLNRPQRVAPLVENLAACSEMIRCRPVFLVSPGDKAEIRAVRAAGLEPVPVRRRKGHGDYPRKINEGFRLTTEKFVFLGADDLTFTPGWAERAIVAWYETGVCVIGTNDAANPNVIAGKHATHSLVHRDYGECGTVDEPGAILHEGYHHVFCDNEFVETAQARETFLSASDVIVRHDHPTWRTADDDDTYREGRSHYEEDRRLYLSRRPLWG